MPTKDVSHGHAAQGPAGGRVGPNAIIQLRRVLVARLGTAAVHELLGRAHLARYVDAEPAAMVSETEVQRLFARVLAELDAQTARDVLHEAGQLTGVYILENRIPRPVAQLLQWLPQGVAAPLLLRAIAAHAWTFAGSGETRVRTWPPFSISIAANPLATPGCPWHVGVLETLFRKLVSRDARLVHTHCCAHGDSDCRTIIGMR